MYLHEICTRCARARVYVVCLLVCVYVRLMFAQNQRQRGRSSLSSLLVRASSHMCGEVYLESCPCHKEAHTRAQQTTMRTRTQPSHRHVARQWWLGGLVLAAAAAARERWWHRDKVRCCAPCSRIVLNVRANACHRVSKDFAYYMYTYI